MYQRGGPRSTHASGPPPTSPPARTRGPVHRHTHTHSRTHTHTHTHTHSLVCRRSRGRGLTAATGARRPGHPVRGRRASAGRPRLRTASPGAPLRTGRRQSTGDQGRVEGRGGIEAEHLADLRRAHGVGTREFLPAAPSGGAARVHTAFQDHRYQVADPGGRPLHRLHAVDPSRTIWRDTPGVYALHAGRPRP